ncbi:hypothetical protein [Gillisia hiemivivida]|jgi:uncharacterized membrane protein YebE (DUF533 family)|uniref:Uncharacterized protein n=1 Tax=Gillisia hiemivivida TaxID=291190 RepID=A0A5C6ZNN8_9FLAO|nr:hypothetical protein [Gillisia hiemivivida]TXD91672.1 hypothetical protein ES724_16280 [Gillisia hiemivivida]
MNHNIKKAATAGAKLWAAKKGLGLTGSVLKLGLFAGAGYLAYTFFRDHKDDIKDKLDEMTCNY